MSVLPVNDLPLCCHTELPAPTFRLGQFRAATRYLSIRVEDIHGPSGATFSESTLQRYCSLTICRWVQPFFGITELLRRLAQPLPCPRAAFSMRRCEGLRSSSMTTTNYMHLKLRSPLKPLRDHKSIYSEMHSRHFPLVVMHQVFKHEDGIEVQLELISVDTSFSSLGSG